tara:strand:- start:46 stop:915 length:870 start_codon:yes stop_codon:yes gene_type:complete
MIIQNFYNHTFDKNIIDKLIFNNLNFYYDNNKKIYYYLLIYPSYLIHNIEKYNKIYTNIINININSKINILLKEKFPLIKLNKFIIVYDNNNYKFTIILNDDFNILSNNILNFFINSINEFNKDLNVIYNSINTLNNSILKSTYNQTELIANSVNAILINLFYYYNIIEQFKNIYNNGNNSFDKYVLNNNINIISEKINKYMEYCYNTRTTSLQRITYLEASNSRLLTSIATVFLPLSFCIAFFSLPFKKIPFRNNNNGIFFIIYILIIILIIIIFYISKLFRKSMFSF